MNLYGSVTLMAPSPMNLYGLVTLMGLHQGPLSAPGPFCKLRQLCQALCLDASKQRDKQADKADKADRPPEADTGPRAFVRLVRFVSFVSS